MLSDRQKAICSGLIVGLSGRQDTSGEDFAREVPEALEDDRLSPSFLRQATDDCDAESLQCALLVGFSCGFPPSSVGMLCELLSADWHHSHEDLVEALCGFDGDSVAQSLFQATRWIPPYLAFDDSRALATKAIWAISRLTAVDVLPLLNALENDPDERLRVVAQTRLKALR